MDLQRDGVTVIQTDFDVATLRVKFNIALTSLPCFNSDATSYVLGGFGALGSPGSFHNPFVRALRLRCLVVVSSWLKPICLPDDNIEMIPGRMLFRPIGVSPSAEMWHRDESPNALSATVSVDDNGTTIVSGRGDHIFGGWINLGTTPHYFSCVLGTHLPEVNQSARTGTTGFSRIGRAEIAAGRYKERRSLVEVAPGAIVLFYENIIHEVNHKKTRVPMYRLHLAHRITQSHQPLIPNLDTLLDRQAVIPMKSAQRPPMHAALHWRNWAGRLETFSRKNVRESLLINRTRLKGKDAGRTYRVVPRYLEDLEGLGLPKYCSYSSLEKSLYHPIGPKINF